MSDVSKKKFTRQELETIVRRSVARQADVSDGSYTIDEMVEAAQELGVDPVIVRQTAEAHVARREKAVVVRPFDTRVTVQSDGGTFQLVVPRLPFRGKHVAHLGFTAFWFAFLTFWTKGAAKGGGFFVAFSIPFWFAGLAMLRRSVLPLLQKTTLTLGPAEGQLVTAPLGRRRRLRVTELRARIGDHARDRHEGMAVEKGNEPAVLLEHGTETIALLDGFSRQEQEWVLAELQAWLSSQST
jgi:hypothetical protein